MFLQRISRVGASLYYATARLRCLNMNILINNAFMCKFIQILGVNAYFKSYYMQNESWNTLTGLFILLVPGWTPFWLQNCLNSLWHRFNKVLETFLRDFGPYWHDSITHLLQICRLHIHDANLPFHHIPLDWDLVTVEAIRVKWTHCHVQETSLRWFELCDIVHCPAGSSHQKMCTL